jgi:pimeloyl-ACP methyl ester carboxylesterase
MKEMPLSISRRHLLAGTGATAAAALFPAATRAYAAGAVNFHKTYADTRMGQVHLLIARPATGTAKRPALAIFHPTAQSGAYFELFMRELATDRIVIAPDTPGYGGSDRPAGPPDTGQYAAALGDALDRVRRDLGIRELDVGGYHTGSMIAIELALQQATRVRRLLLAAIPYYEAGPKRQQMLERLSADKPLSPELDYVANTWKFHVTQRNPAMSLERGFQNFWTELRSEPYHAWGFRAVFSYPAEQRLPQVRQPVGIMNVHVGLTEQTRAAAALLPHARVVEIPELTSGVFDVGAARLAREARALLDDWDGVSA